MKKIRMISYQKSGLHLLVQMLLKYYSGDITKRLIFDIDKKNGLVSYGDFTLCVRVYHCGKTPCLNQKTTFQVMHACDVAWQTVNDINYLFVYRNPIRSFISLLGYGETEEWKIAKPKRIIKWLENRTIHWKKWVYKWIIGHEGNNVYKLTYEELTLNPFIEFKKLLEYINPEKEVDIQLLQLIIKEGYKGSGSTGYQEGIILQHGITDFVHYKMFKNYLQKLEKSLEKELNLLNIPKIEWK